MWQRVTPFTCGHPRTKITPASFPSLSYCLSICSSMSFCLVSPPPLYLFPYAIQGKMIHIPADSWSTAGQVATRFLQER